MTVRPYHVKRKFWRLCWGLFCDILSLQMELEMQALMSEGLGLETEMQREVIIQVVGVDALKRNRHRTRRREQADQEGEVCRKQGSTSKKCHVAALKGARTLREGVIHGVKCSTHMWQNRAVRKPPDGGDYEALGSS